VETDKTSISITSKSITGAMGGGVLTKRNEQNIEILLSNVSNYLQGKEIQIKGGSSKSILVTLLLCILLGWLGVHRFYVGKIGSGILYMFTLGIFGIGILFDAIRILIGNFTDKKGDYISNW
jgi:TM2 domain-containing membrane protein YozV